MTSNIDPAALAARAMGTLRRRGVGAYMDLNDLQSVGALAIVESGVTDEALAVAIAHRRMVNAIQANTVRERGRVRVSKGHAFDCAEVDVSMQEMWEATVYGSQSLEPKTMHYDLWEVMRALTPQQYRAITLTFWGGLGLEDVAMEMQISFGRVAQLLRAAQKNMKSALQKTIPQLITNMRGEETQRTTLSSRAETQI